jgi:multiple sugar transport system permease protein/putative aldouronate transport system permease protein
MVNTETKADLIFLYAVYGIFFIVLIAVGYPMLYVISASFSSPNAVISGRVWLFPVDFSLKGYEKILNTRQVMIGYMNSAIYMVFGTMVNVVMTILAAYPLSRSDFKYRKPISVLFLFTMLFNGGLVPTYLLVKSLGMVDTRLAMIIPNALIVYNMIVARTYFSSSIPIELLEASQLDGCSDFRFVYSVVLPLSGPVIAVLTLWYAVTHWNSYFWALVYLRDDMLYPLQIALRSILLQAQMAETFTDVDAKTLIDMQGLSQLLKYSLIVVASAPLLALYPVIQKYFVKGVMIGSIKG